MMEIKLRLPDKVYQEAQRWATLTQQDLDIALTEALEIALAPVHADPETDVPVVSMSDEEVVALTQAQMPLERGRHLSQLSSLHAEGKLSLEGQQELTALVGLYQRLWLRQSEALAEAVRRGLQSEMHS